MDAELCHAITRALTSSFFRSTTDILMTGAKEGQSARDYLIEAGINAYSFDALPDGLQQYLKLCDRSVAIHEQLFGGAPTGLTTEQEDARVMTEMDKEE